MFLVLFTLIFHRNDRLDRMVRFFHLFNTILDSSFEKQHFQLLCLNSYKIIIKTYIQYPFNINQFIFLKYTFRNSIDVCSERDYLRRHKFVKFRFFNVYFKFVFNLLLCFLYHLIMCTILTLDGTGLHQNNGPRPLLATATPKPYTSNNSFRMFQYFPSNSLYFNVLKLFYSIFGSFCSISHLFLLQILTTTQMDRLKLLSCHTV